jgi:hypothetical protein
MRIVTMNEDALVQAATFLVGPQATNAIIGLYQLIDRLQKDAYDLGVNVGETNIDQAEAEAWDLGYDQGEADGMEMADDAYVQGVADARAWPEVADEKVAFLCDKDAFNGEAKHNAHPEGEEWDQYFDPSEYTPVDDEDESGRCPCGDPSCEYNN